MEEQIQKIITYINAINKDTPVNIIKNGDNFTIVSTVDLEKLILEPALKFDKDNGKIVGTNNGAFGDDIQVTAIHAKAKKTEWEKLYSEEKEKSNNLENKLNNAIKNLEKVGYSKEKIDKIMSNSFEQEKSTPKRTKKEPKNQTKQK